MSNSSLYASVRKRHNLHAAWKKVHSSGITSQSKETQEQVRKFAENSYRNLERIGEQLRGNRFRFDPATGIPIHRAGKDPRPIVVAPIESRIVQRSILEVLQSHPEIQGYTLTPTSYGGVKSVDGGRRVRDAISHAYTEMQKDKRHYIRSDIKSFFTQIDRQKVLTVISKFIKDSRFLALLDTAITTELQNLAALGKKADIFPIGEIGVAQGCCLSPLMGNILLHNFDMELNQRGIVCLRYIDDFLLMGNKKSSTEKAFFRAQELLSDLGLSAYDPLTVPEKAAAGELQQGFEFLGCEVTQEAIYPSLKSRKGLYKRIDQAFIQSSRAMASPELLRAERLSLVDTLKYANNVLEGWGNQYAFCNCKTLFDELDREIDSLIATYLGKYKRHRERHKDDPVQSRQLLGLHPLVASHMDSIIRPPD